MKTIARVFAVLMVLMLVGCASGGSGGSSTSSLSSSSGKQLTDEDYKRLGIKETGNTNR